MNLNIPPRPSLGIDLSLDTFEDSLDGLSGTFRAEGMSVAYDRLTVGGQDFNMEVLESDLKTEATLGHGACSTVYRARHKRTGDLYAIKMFNIYDRSRRAQFQKELSLLSRVQCDSLINFYGAFHRNGDIGIIMEYMDIGSLEMLCRPDVPVTNEAMACITFQVIWGLGYLHFENSLHRDIKPGNLLMNSQGAVKLADFGIARALEHSQAMSNTSCGTFRYMSLERLLAEEYNASSDIWSLGVMLIELWTKRFPFEEGCASPIHMVQALEEFSLRGPDSIIPTNCSRRMREFLYLTLTQQSNKKPDTGGFLKCGWFVEAGITDLNVAQEGVRNWLNTFYTPKQTRSHGRESKWHSDSEDDYAHEKFEDDDEETHRKYHK